MNLVFFLNSGPLDGDIFVVQEFTSLGTKTVEVMTIDRPLNISLLVLLHCGSGFHV